MTRLSAIYEIAIKTRNFEISQLVQRNNFFMIFQGVLLASVISSNNTVAFVHFMISLAGLLVAYFQTKMAAGAKYWQEYWETEVVIAESNLKNLYENNNSEFQFIPLFNKKSKIIKKQVSKQLGKSEHQNLPRHLYNSFIRDTFNSIFSTKNLILSKPSVSKIPIHVGRSLIIIWILLLFSSTSLGDNYFASINGQKIFTGFPGKSITNIDIRNQPKPNRNDGFDDDRETISSTNDNKSE